MPDILGIKDRLRREEKKRLRERERALWAKRFPGQPLPEAIDETPVEMLSQYRMKKRHLLLREVAYRRMQALKLYEPLPKQEEFHRCHSPERIILGGNRGAKTMCCAAEVAMAVTGTHPYIDYPKSGKWICVSKDAMKIGEIFYAKLFMPGAFKMVKDKKTDLYRAWRPWTDGFDCERRDALSLIPRRMVKSIAWEEKSLNQPKKIVLTNGWEILFFTSAGKPMEGVDVDGAWFDEEVYEKKTLGSWYDEMAARLIDRRGKFIWSATPQAATAQLWKLHEVAMEERGKDIPKVSEFHVTMDDNPFLPPEAKEEFRAKAARDPDEYRVRVLGEFLITTHFVYPDFRRTTHTCLPFEIPANYARYLVVDPGYANVVGLFFAVPPAKGPPHVYIYDEVYGHQWNARTFVQNIRQKILGHNFQAFIMDRKGSMRTESSGKTIGQQYADEMAILNLRSIETGSNFILIGETGHANLRPVAVGCSQVREWLWNRDEFEGTPKLQVFDTCTNFIDEIGKYRNKIDKGRATDIPDGSRFSHGPDCLRYAVVHGIPWVEPKPVKKPRSAIHNYLERKLKKKRQEDGNYVLLGPSATKEYQ